MNEDIRPPRRAAEPESARALLALAWPILVGQVAVIGLGVVDTVMAGRLSATDLAAVALGSSLYATVFVGFMATLHALTPIAGHHFGAGRMHEIGIDVGQTLWLAMFLTLAAEPLLLANPVWLLLIGAEPEVVAVASPYLFALAAGLPAALASRAYVAMNAAVSRPAVTMVVNLVALAAKVPLNALLMYGAGPLPALGGAGCGLATALLMWLMLLANWALWRFDPFYRRFRAPARAPRGPRWQRQRELLRIGLPSGATTLIEVSSFTFITLLLARFGATVVAGHRIVADLAALLFMLPLSYGIAGSVLVAQALGRGAPASARRAAILGFRLTMGTTVLAILAIWLLRQPLVALFSRDPQVAAVALGLLAYGLLFHLFDAAQGVCGFILRGYKVAFVPMLIHGVTLWAVGLAGGVWLAYAPPQGWPLTPAASFWLAAAFGLAIAAIALAWLAEYIARGRIRESQ